MSRLLEQLRNAVGQQVSMLSEELPDDAPAGTVSDLAFFGSISALLAGLEKGRIDTAEWERRARALGEDAGRVTPASTIFVDLARRKVRREANPRKANPRKANQGIPDSQRLPDFSEGCAVARVMLVSTRTKDRWERDLQPDAISQRIAEHWLSRRSFDDLLSIIGGAEQSTIFWDALELVCDSLGGESVRGRRGEFARYKTEPPLPLLAWRFEAVHGLRERPPEPPPPRYRPTKLGYIIRDIRIKEAIQVLEQLGMPPTGGTHSGCSVVAAVLEKTPAFDERTVRDIWRMPDEEINESYAKCLDRQLV